LFAPLRVLIAVSASALALNFEIARAETADAAVHRMFAFFDAAETRPGLDQQLVTSLRDKVRLIRELTLRNKEAVRTEYIRGLSLDATLLENALEQPNSALSNQTVAFVRDDLSLKLTFETSVAGSQESFRGKVQVNIATKRSGTDVSGLLVGANPKLWQDQRELMFPIGPSSPAHGSLPPGIYRIFVKKAGGETVVTQDAPVGLAGKDSEDVTIVLPDGQ
jgi:hypothetical protein